MQLRLKDDVVDAILKAIGEGTLKDLCESNAEKKPDFMAGATNVYRTKKHVVKQEITFVKDENKNTFMMSEDTYYLRNPKLDDTYNYHYAERKHIEGKRIPVAMYTRKYKE